MSYCVDTAPTLAATAPDALAAIIARHSRSFALASRLLPPAVRADALVLYAYCRRVDDAIDCRVEAEQPEALAALRAELDDVYGARPLRGELLPALRELVRARGIPRLYLDELLLGMEMDVRGTRYTSVPGLLRYCYRVAGTVGLMMCHAMGVRRQQALLHASHLGIAMQLTNIARDVLEDWTLGRLYLPTELLARHGVFTLEPRLGAQPPPSAWPALAGAIADLLDLADGYYRSGDAGLRDLSPRCALGVRVARLVYADIGRVLRTRGCDPRSGRAVVGDARKLWLVARALAATLWSLPGALLRARVRTPASLLHPDEAIVLHGAHP